MNMFIKKALIIGLSVTALSVSGQVFQPQVFNVDPANQSIPDFTPEATGVTFLGTVSGVNSSDIPITYYMKVGLNLQGDPIAYTGDYYATLTDVSTGIKAVLLNRVGKDAATPLGYGDNGMNIILQDTVNGFGTAKAPDIHTYRNGVDPSVFYSPLGATGNNVFSPDARDIDPTRVVTGDPRNRDLSQFSYAKADPNGTWALYIQDMNQGGQGKLVSWSLQFVPVPEPTTYALVFGIALIGFGLYRRFAVKAA